MNDFIDHANYLHQKFPVVDTHLDLAAEIFWRNKLGEDHIIEKRLLPSAKKGGVNIIVSSIFIENSFLPESGMEIMLSEVVALQKDIESSSSSVMAVKNVEDLHYALNHNILGIILYCEGLDQIGHDISKLKSFYDMGVRGASLTWSRTNELAQGCCSASLHENWPGHVTPYGIEALHELERLGMFVDVSHLNDDGFNDVLANTRKPFLATHSNCRSVYNSYRNLRDDQIISLASRGGIMGLNSCMLIVGSSFEEAEKNVPKMADHIEHILEIVGENHAGYGFDFCNSYNKAFAQSNKNVRPKKEDCLPLGYKQITLVTAELLKRGHSENTIRKIIGENFISYFEKALPKK